MSNLGGRRVLDLDWVESWARRVNEDRVLPVIGRFFSVRFVLGIDDTDFLCEVRRGKIERISEGLVPSDMGYEFALRAPSAAWMKFSQKVPPRCSTISGQWPIRCTNSSTSKAIKSRSGKTCGR